MPSELSTRPEPKANVLLVDDTPANLLALEAVLDDLGYNLAFIGACILIAVVRAVAPGRPNL